MLSGKSCAVICVKTGKKFTLQKFNGHEYTGRDVYRADMCPCGGLSYRRATMTEYKLYRQFVRGEEPVLASAK
mgnify:CR=1 FL=1